jgi:hypothetical protein
MANLLGSIGGFAANPYVGAISAGVGLVNSLRGLVGQGRRWADAWVEAVQGPFEKRLHELIDPITAATNNGTLTPEMQAQSYYALQDLYQQYQEASTAMKNSGDDNAVKVAQQSDASVAFVANDTLPKYQKQLETFGVPINNPQGNDSGVQFSNPIQDQPAGQNLIGGITSGINLAGSLNNIFNPATQPTANAPAGSSPASAIPGAVGGAAAGAAGAAGSAAAGTAGTATESLLSQLAPYLLAGGSVGASIASGIQGSNAANDAAKIQADSAKYAADLQSGASKDALALQKSQFDQAQANQQPWLDAGKNALSQLQSDLPGLTAGYGQTFNPAAYNPSAAFNPTPYTPSAEFNPTPYTPSAEFNPTPYQNGAQFNPTAYQNSAAYNPDTYKAYGKEFSMDPSQLVNDPGYQFRLAEGEKGIQRSAAAKSGVLSGAALKSLQRYDQGLAAQQYNDAYAQQLQGYQTNASQYEQDQMNKLNQQAQIYGTNFNTDQTNQNNVFNRENSVFNTNQNQFNLDQANRLAQESGAYNTNFNTQQANQANQFNRESSAYNTNFNTQQANQANQFNQGLQAYNTNFNTDQANQQNAYNQGLQTYQTNYNQFQQEQANRYNRLANIGGLGQTAAGNLASTGANYANQGSNTLLQNAENLGNISGQGANATAAGLIGGANAVQNATGNISNTLAQLLALQAK